MGTKRQQDRPEAGRNGSVIALPQAPSRGPWRHLPEWRAHLARWRHYRDEQNSAGESTLREARALGMLLLSTERNKGGRPAKTQPTLGSVSPRPTLAELEIERHESERFQKIARIPEDRFERYIAQPPGDEITMAGALAIAKEILYEDRREKRFGRIARSCELPNGEKRWAVILADPPWQYEQGPRDSSISPESQYATMSLEQIGKLPVIEKIAANRSVLFLWAPNPKLAEALTILHILAARLRA